MAAPTGAAPRPGKTLSGKTLPGASVPGEPGSGKSLSGKSSPRKRKTRQQSNDTRAAWLFISPWLVGFLVFTAWPLIYSAYLSLTDYDVINAPNFVGFANYRQLLDDPKIAKSLGNTLYYTVIQVPLHMLVALALALLLERAGRRSGFFRTAFYLPKMTPPVAVGIMLLLLFNDRGYGVLRNTQDAFVNRRSGVDLTTPDFHCLASALDLPYWGVENLEQIEDALAQALSTRGPAIVEVDVDAMGAMPRPFTPPVRVPTADPQEAASSASLWA